ncbi:MAG: DUF1080 domain-containing protein [Lentisphaerae bacterium]|nr:DUF1080 domain-containing protein [Lentisphaerota bacterium]MBT4816423.1 DUF1080 domain-containing protein [Lentisphaerota bacterium]MBT5604581.1 DUF1080 domain-containing protein [Lentisphaerota bacterium]MBT7061754.1 DUF1080 domain-containing protein [Lentisphaerota bacterium]MBT7848788.1 DUF1080 domain-containing protein [Lentisphaerota bacterium]
MRGIWKNGVRMGIVAVVLSGSAMAGPATTWQDLFDGKALGLWKATEFGGTDEVSVRDGCIVLEMGAADLSGVTWTGAVERRNYELELEAQRVDGDDFFCGLTFPYGETCCSLIVGGWGGELVGISSLDDLDASENETTVFQPFESKRWYRIRVRVTSGKIQAWIDEKQVVDVQPGDRKVGVRAEVEASQPLGIAAWRTKAALRKIRLRSIPPPPAED